MQKRDGSLLASTPEHASRGCVPWLFCVVAACGSPDPSGNDAGGSVDDGLGGGATTGGAGVTDNVAITGGAVNTGNALDSNAGTGGAGAGANATGGTTGCGQGFWATAYDPTGGNGLGHQNHYVGQSCITGRCHTSSRPLVYAGTVYLPDGVTGAANVQISVKSGSTLHSTYSGSAGNFWLQAGSIADFGSTQICLRTATGEVLKAASDPSGADCNGSGCHTGALRLLAP